MTAQEMKNKELLQNMAALAMIVLFFIFNVLSVQGKHWTMDEPNHLHYGTNILNGDSTRFDDSKMPFSAWNALPAKIAGYLPDSPVKVYLGKMIIARSMTTIFSMLVAWMVFFWSRKLYGIRAAFASLVLYILDPNIIAHSQLVTTDIYVTGMILFCTYWLWKFASTRRWQDGLIFAVILGVAQLAKYTAVSLYPLLTITWIGHEVWKWKKDSENGIRLDVKKEAGGLALYILIVAVISIVIINIGFLFNRSFTWVSEYKFRSHLFQQIQTMVNVPVPTPYPFLEGFDWINFKERSGGGFGRIYLLGQIHFGRGFAGYYIVASLLKVPIATQVILWLALFYYFFKKREAFWQDEWFLLWLVLFYTIYFNFFYNAQIGIRYYLIVFPLLYIFAGSLFRDLSRAQWAGMSLLGIYLLASVLSYYPNYLGYFNEIVWDRKTAYKYLADSNLAWEQDVYLLKVYRDTHRYADKAPEVPSLIHKTQTYFVPINQLVGVTYDPSTYKWLRDNFEPIDEIGTSYLLFEITPQQMETLCSTTSYCK